MAENFDKPKTKEDIKKISKAMRNIAKQSGYGSDKRADKLHEEAKQIEQKAQEVGHAKASGSTMKKQLDQIKKDFEKHQTASNRIAFKHAQAEKRYTANQEKAAAYGLGYKAQVNKQKLKDSMGR